MEYSRLLPKLLQVVKLVLRLAGSNGKMLMEIRKSMTRIKELLVIPIPILYSV
jgi:hypothetical protein